MLDKTKKAIRDFTDLTNFVRGEISKVDPGLRDSVKKDREADIMAKHAGKLNELRAAIADGRKHFQERRLRESSPATALMRNAWENQHDYSPGMAVVADAVAGMPVNEMLGFVEELRHPTLTLRAVNALRERQHSTDDPGAKADIAKAIDRMTDRYIDRGNIKACARVEIECIEAELLQIDAFGGDATTKLTIAHELTPLREIAKDGLDPEIRAARVADAQALSDPLERIDAGHAMAA